MIKSIKNWLNKPYYADFSLNYRIYNCIITGLYVFIFLYVFRPFQLDLIENNIFIYTLGYGIVTFLVLFLNIIIFPLKITSSLFKEENRTILKEIIIILLSILMIGVACWFYFLLVTKGDNVPNISLIEMILKAFYIGFFQVTIFLFIDERKSRKKREKISKQIMASKPKSNPIKNVKKIQLFGENNKESIIFCINELIFISCQGNYISLYINSNHKIKEHVLRNTLTNVIFELKEYKNIIRCHKSYIINIDNVDSISGNARGYFLISNKISKQIPVSRKFNKEKLKSLIR
jgi:DNA-binding LytR/AlgR family response regulator